MKYCTDCKWYEAANAWRAYPMCWNPAGRDPVGEYRSAYVARDGICGSEGTLFEAKPPAPPPQPGFFSRLFRRRGEA